MARIILKDLGLTLHVLRVANSPLYNRSGRPIIGIVHAITLLGWDTVRNLVGAMRFIEHYARQAPGLRELMMFSMLTATHSRQIAAQIGYPRPEEAYVCGLFRNLGEVLLARHFSRGYAHVLLLMEQDGISEHAACMQEFGFTFEELAVRLADCWTMPSCVRQTLDGGKSCTSNEDRCLASVASYGHELTSVLYRRGGPVEALPARALFGPTGANACLSRRDIRNVVNQSVDDTRDTFNALRIPIGALGLDKQAEEARAILNALDQAQECGGFAEMDASLAAAGSSLVSSTFEISAFIHALLDAMTQRLGFERAVFALLSEDRTSIRGRIGSGADSDDALQLFQFSLMRGDPALSAAIDRKLDLWINAKSELRYTASRITSLFDAPNWLLLPVAVGDVVAGTIFAERRLGFTSGEVKARVEEVRRLIAAGIAKMRLV